MSESTKDAWKELRKPFPAGTVGKLPKGGIMLDYVGHAAVTDRLLDVDPKWSWEPLGVQENGLPATDLAGNLWIKLTVNGVTRIGVGDGKNAKECISDAIRNAAMRFGVALDLWSKEELESTLADPSMKNERASTAAPVKPAVGSATRTVQIPDPSGSGQMRTTIIAEPRTLVTEAQVKLLLARARDASGLTDRQEIYDWFLETFGLMPNEVKKADVDQILRDMAGIANDGAEGES